MASRQLRKLRKLQELSTPREEGHDESSSDGEEPVQTKPRANAFAAFAALGGEEDEDEDKASDGDHSEPNAEAAEEPAPEPTPTPVRKNKASKKKKRKKAARPPTEPEHVDPDEDEIDRAIQELNLNSRGGEDVVLPKAWQQLARLFAINFHHLKVINEMRRVFGNEVIVAAQTEDGAQGPTGGRSRRARQMPREMDLETFLRGIPGKGISDVILRRNPFIDGRSHWPRASAGGLTMTTVGNAEGESVEFAFSHDDAYSRMEAQFFMFVQMHDPMQLVYFLQKNPYHVSTLIQVSKVAKQDQNSALAAELCERALFTFGRITVSRFRKKLEEGKATMDFRRPENRQFWLAGYNYIKSLVMKGTYRTALEWAKLFLGISTHDPYGMINWIHPLAIRSHEARWFIELCDTHLLCAVDPEIPTAMYIRQTLVLAKLQLGDAVGAEASLIKGMEELPWLYGAIFSALNLDTPKSIWGVTPRDPEEELHTQLYIHMAKDLWNNAQATALLAKAGSLARKVDASTLPPPPFVTLNTARFIYLDNTPALMAVVPRNMLHAAPNFDFDPLPPAKEDNIFSSKSQELPWAATSNDEFTARLAQMERERAPGQIPEEQLRELEEVANDESVPEAERGILRRFLDAIMPLGVLGGGNIEAADSEDDDDLAPRVPGAWEDDEGGIYEAEHGDDFEDVDDFGDTVDDFGDTVDDDDGFPREWVDRGPERDDEHPPQLGGFRRP